MTTLYQTIAAIRTAEGSPLNPELSLDLFGNDWSLLGGVQDVRLPEDSVASATTAAWVDMQDIWFEMPTYALDVTFDDMEVVVWVRLEAYGSATPDCDIRLANEAVTVTGTAVSVTQTSYAEETIELAFPLASIPTGRTQIKVQGRWNSDPGTETLFTRRVTTSGVGDMEIFIRLVP